MKIILRAFALSLVVTGAFATAHTNKNTSATKLNVAASAMPIPMCPPGVPDGCGIGNLSN